MKTFSRILIAILLALVVAAPVGATRLHDADVTSIAGTISEANSTATPLGAGGVFTGTAEDATNYAMIYITTYSDVASATDGLSIQQSSDGVNWDHTDEYSVAATSGKTFSFQAGAKWFRVVYTNGAVAQAEFRLQTKFLFVYGKPSSHRIQDSINTDDDAELIKSVIAAQIAGDGFTNIGASDTGNLKVTDAENGLAIAKGDVVGTTFQHKFGNAPDFDTVDGYVTVWDGAEDGTTWELMNYVYSTTADIDSVSSSNAADVYAVTVVGLDTDYNEVTQVVTLTGQVRAALPTPLVRVYRAYNSNSTEFVGHVFVYVNGALTGGVPNTNADIRAVIQPEDQQTLMAVYTVPAGKTGYVRDWYMATSGGNKSSNYVVKLKAREFGGVFRTKHISAMESLAPVPYQHEYREPEVFPAKTDIEMIVQSIASPAAVENSVAAGFDIVLVDN